MKNLILGTIIVFLTGCLVTRQEVREAVKSEPLTPEQQRRANNEIRNQELDEQMRQMLGRVESVENSINILSADKNGSRMENLNERKSLQEKLVIYEEAIGKLETQYLALAQKVEALHSNENSQSSRDTKSPVSRSSYDVAESDFSNKKWKESIVSFEKYRSTNPSGKRYGEATYKIGFSFHELNMKTEAKAFYSEVVDKFPRSEWAKKAQQRLKTIK